MVADVEPHTPTRNPVAGFRETLADRGNAALVRRRLVTEEPNKVFGIVSPHNVDGSAKATCM